MSQRVFALKHRGSLRIFRLLLLCGLTENECPWIIGGGERPGCHAPGLFLWISPADVARHSAGSRTSSQREMRLIVEPSSVKLYISPLGSRMNPMTGLEIRSV